MPSSVLTPKQRLEDEDASLGIERARRLVAQQHFRPLGDGARDGDALLLAARELRREVVHAVFEPDNAQGPRPGASGASEISVTSATFSLARKARDQIIELEDEADMVDGDSA